MAFSSIAEAPAACGIVARFINWLLPCIHPDVSYNNGKPHCLHCGEDLS